MSDDDNWVKDEGYGEFAFFGILFALLQIVFGVVTWILAKIVKE